MDASPKLTPRQQDIMALILRTIETTGAPPTRAEIATEFGFRSHNAAEEHLRALARKGVIELVGGTSRGIRLKSDILRSLRPGTTDSADAASPDTMSVPLVVIVVASTKIGELKKTGTSCSAWVTPCVNALATIVPPITCGQK